uniref:Dimer_Tnp_hAT domain-containing protein n=1 Tax=Ascaris lumbricoides TaxID=6252 RepID=A0A0M3I0C1_ASCLU
MKFTTEYARYWKGGDRKSSYQAKQLCKVKSAILTMPPYLYCVTLWRSLNSANELKNHGAEPLLRAKEKSSSAKGKKIGHFGKRLRSCEKTSENQYVKGLNEWVEWSSTFRKKITSPVMLEEENIVLGRKATNTDGSTIEEFFKITRNEKETILDEMDKQV